MNIDDLHLRYIKPDWFVAKVNHGDHSAVFCGTPMWITAQYQAWRDKVAGEIYNEADDQEQFVKNSFIKRGAA